MAAIVVMPKLGMTMTEGVITKWLKAEGDDVIKGESILVVESDKANVEIDASESGKLVKILRNEREILPVAEPIGIIANTLEDGLMLLNTGNYIAEKPLKEMKQTEISTVGADFESDMIKGAEISDSLKKMQRIFASPRAKALARKLGINLADIRGTGPEGIIIERDLTVLNSRNEPKVTPLAKKLIEQSDLDLYEIKGSGTHGRIMKEDVESVLKFQHKEKSSSGKVLPFKGIRKIISDRMMESLHGMAQANHRIKVDMSEAIRLREGFKQQGRRVSYSDILIKIVARALRDFPIMNSSLTEEGILMKEDVNIGMATAIESGLVVPVIAEADKKNLDEIAKISAELVEKAKNGRLIPNDYSGGTFTVTNLGMYDIDEFTAIINPPEIGILAVGKIDRIPVAEGDSILIKPIMMLSLTYDHRVVDGAPAAHFLQRIKQLLQDPYLLL